MGAAAIARIAEEGGRRRRSCKGPIITDIGPQSSGNGLGLRQHRDGGVVDMEPLRGKDMRFDQMNERLQCRNASADLVGERREAKIDTFERIAIALTVQWLVRAELLEQHHGKKAWAEHAARGDMKGCGWL